jgi:hypothetical protein
METEKKVGKSESLQVDWSNWLGLLPGIEL